MMKKLLKKRGQGSQYGYHQTLPPQTPERQEYARAIAADVGNMDEQWDIYYHAFLLHRCKHSQCYWYRNTWWFPETGRNVDTLSMFSASRYPPQENIKYYNMHLPNGKMLENGSRYIGPNTAEEGWLGDYVGYNLNLVTFDMKPIPSGGQS
ncbi:uncharacterized protein I206_104110 [Kwoniella pini CBS 10737]|uniref:Uncharacterized protein n=1 Tax=Kwoniella pini CBS 10737 TaxID=1296096 RepID=A0AAJ8MQY6_9TREE